MNQQSIENNPYSQNMNRMRMGTGAGNLIYGSDLQSHHYIDSLQRFQKDFATADRQRREEERLKKEAEIQKKRLQYLERESKRWEVVENQMQKQKERYEVGLHQQILGKKRTANNNGLPFNPINLEYDKNPEGEKLKYRDEDHQIRGYVRAHNMDHKGNSKYNPLTGQTRIGIEKLIPDHLNNRFGSKLQQHYDNLALKIPSSAYSTKSHGQNSRRERHQEFLRKVKLFYGMNENLIDVLGKNLREVMVKAGDTVIREGDQGNQMYLVEEGNLVVTKLIDGRQKQLRQYGTGDYFGQLALIRKAPREATIRAKTNCLLLTVTQELFEQVIGPHNPAILANMSRYEEFNRRN